IEGRDLVLLSNSGESLRILNHMADSHSAVDRIEFADGVVDKDTMKPQFTASVILDDLLTVDAIDGSWTYLNEPTETPIGTSDSQPLVLARSTILSLDDVLSTTAATLDEVLVSTDTNSAATTKFVGGDVSEYPIYGVGISALIEEMQVQLANNLDW
ncbi:hypothetical protein LZU85_11015, partial [Vibrio sp. IRLE0018]|uniref:calcium-binding protein n=1 Tax=Vibrio floridensis TaxID=2908007 RepID=UPI001F302325